MNPYIINHVLNIKVESDKKDEIREKLIDMNCCGTAEEAEPYFCRVDFWELEKDEQTDKTKFRKSSLSGCWTVSGCYDRILGLVGGEDAVKIGNPPITLEQALAEVETAVETARLEHERMAKVVENFDKANDNYRCLNEYGYGKIFNLMKAQADIDRQAVLEDIRDSLRSIAESMQEISKK